MKKIMYTIISLCLIATMTCSFASCTSKKTTDNDKNQSVSQQEDTSKEESSTEESSTENNSAKFSTVKDFIESDIVKSQLDSIKSQLESAGLSVNIYAEGDSTIVYEYKYGQQLTVTDELKQTLDKALEAQSSTFKSVLSAISLAVNVDNPTCVIKYLNADGSEVLVKEFKK